MGTRERLRTNTSGTPQKTQLRADQRAELALEKNASRGVSSRGTHGGPPCCHPGSPYAAPGSVSSCGPGTSRGAGPAPGPETPERERRSPRLGPRRSTSRDHVCSVGEGTRAPGAQVISCHTLPSRQDQDGRRGSWCGAPTAETGKSACLESCVRHDFLWPQ